MKKIVFVWDKDTDLDEVAENFDLDDPAPVHTHGDFKILEISEDGVKQIYPKDEIDEVQTIPPMFIEMSEKPKKKKGKYHPPSKYPSEMVEYVRENLYLPRKELCKKIKEKFGVETDASRLSSWMHYKGIKGLKGTKRPNPKRNIQNKYDLEINGEKVPLEIMQHVEKNTDLDPIVLQDQIIELFEKHYRAAEIKAILSNFKKQRRILPPIGE